MYLRRSCSGYLGNATLQLTLTTLTILRSWRVFRDELLNLYFKRLIRKLNLLPIYYWLEIKDFFFKWKQGLYDLDISSFVTFSSNRSSRTRSSKDNLLQVNPCKTSLFRNSFFNRIVFLWNNLSPIIRNSTSVSSFKLQLHSHYSSKLDSSFDVNRMRTWKTCCSKCRSLNLSGCS